MVGQFEYDLMAWRRSSFSSTLRPLYGTPRWSRICTTCPEKPHIGNCGVLFMKGTPQFPMCGFSGQVVQILDHLGVPYKGLNVLENDDLRQAIKSYSNWPTIPQLYVKGEFVGGCDIIREMFQAGELQSLLKDKGVAVKQREQA